MTQALDPKSLPPRETQAAPSFPPTEDEHRYGDRVHIHSNPFLRSLLARVGGQKVDHPELSLLVREMYRYLLIAAAGLELPTVEARVPTRMFDLHPRHGIYIGPTIDPETRVVVVDILRGGLLPSQTCFELLQSVLPTENVRLDHLTMERKSDSEGRVNGVDLYGSKIGGSVAGATLLIPDPMGATGSTIERAVEHYREDHGEPGRILVLPMIATPEFLKRVLPLGDEVRVHTMRLDRGLSAPEVLATVPGTRWDEERGLNEKGYIVPGAGGVGEVLSNSWC